MKIIHGIAHGKMIELQEDLGLPEGQAIEVSIRTSMIEKKGKGLLRTEGALADDPYWDDIMEKIHQERKDDSRFEPLE